MCDTQIVLERMLAAWQSETEFTWLLFTNSDNKLVGAISARPDGHRIDLGYVLARSHWNQGLMTEALLAVLPCAFTQPSVFRVSAVCDTANPASARVLEQAGLQRKGTPRPWALHPTFPPLLVIAPPMPKPAATKRHSAQDAIREVVEGAHRSHV